MNAKHYSKRIGIAESYRVIEALKVNFVLDDEPDTRGNIIGHYRGNLSDATLAQKLGRGITANHVQRIRQEMFGHLLTPIEKHNMRLAREAKQGQLPLGVKPLPADDTERVLNTFINNATGRFEAVERRVDYLEITLSKLLKDLGVAEEMAAVAVEDDNGEEDEADNDPLAVL